MSNPLAPNYVNGVGRLVTDRFDFQKHVDGYEFRHNANQIDLSPSVVIDGYTETTVQDAIQLLSNYVVPPTIQDATTTSKGIIQLSGDLTGTASTVEVSGLRSQPITTAVPNLNDVLTYDGSAWAPLPVPNGFTAGNDLSGTNLSQNVVQITGSGGVVSVAANSFTFSETSTPIFDQDINTTTSGSHFIINAQGSSISNGGFVKISGGTSGGGALKGAVHLCLNNGIGTEPLVQVTEVAPNRRVVTLAHDSDLDVPDMPADTGDRVIYIRDAATDPGAGIPTNGTILYSSGGTLRVKQADGLDFLVGSIPNPSIWGLSGQQVISYRSYVTSTNSRALAYRYTIPNNTSVKVDVLYVGRRQTPSTDTYEVNLSMGYSCDNAGVITNVGAVTPYDLRTSGGAGIWNVPQFSLTGNLLDIETGFLAMTTIRWMVVVQITVCSGV